MSFGTLYIPGKGLFFIGVFMIGLTQSYVLRENNAPSTADCSI